MTRALAVSETGRHADALADWDRALERDDGSNAALLRAGRAVSLARLGEHDKALADVAGVVEGQAAPAVAVYSAATVYAVVAAAVKGDADRAEKYAARAVALLRRAHRAGYFKQAALVDGLKKHADFEPLRQRDDFRQLLKEIEGASTPPAESGGPKEVGAATVRERETLPAP